MKLHSPLYEPAESGGPTPGSDAGTFTPPPAAPAWHAEIFDPSTPGQFAKGWTDKLPDSLADAKPTLANYDSFEKVVKSLLDNKRAATAKTDGMVRLPGPDAKPEDVAAFRKALGVPDVPDAYGLKAPEGLPPGVEWSDDLAKGFAEQAHKAGLAAPAAQQLAEWYVAQQTAQAQAQEQEVATMRADAEKDLRSTFGKDYDAKIALAARTAQTAGIPADSPAFHFPEVVKAFALLGSRLGEQQLVPGNNVTGMLSPASQARDIQTNPQNPFYQRYRSGDAEIMALVRRLHEQSAA